MRRLWLDDVRPAPPGWTRVRTAKEAVDALCRGGRVAEISLDYDLYDQPTPNPGNGMDVMRWLLARAREGRWDCIPPTIHIHTANEFAAPQMTWVKRKIEQLQTRKT